MMQVKALRVCVLKGGRVLEGKGKTAENLSTNTQESIGNATNKHTHTHTHTHTDTHTLTKLPSTEETERNTRSGGREQIAQTNGTKRGGTNSVFVSLLPHQTTQTAHFDTILCLRVYLSLLF